MKDTHTPPRSVRVDVALWEAAKAKATSEGRTVSDVVVSALRAYLRDEPITPHRPAA